MCVCVSILYTRYTFFYRMSWLCWHTHNLFSTRNKSVYYERADILIVSAMISTAIIYSSLGFRAARIYVEWTKNRWQNRIKSQLHYNGVAKSHNQFDFLVVVRWADFRKWKYFLSYSCFCYPVTSETAYVSASWDAVAAYRSTKPDDWKQNNDEQMLLAKWREERM